MPQKVLQLSPVVVKSILAFLILYILYAMSAIVLYLLNRKHYFIQKRAVTLSVLGSLCSMYLIVVQITSHIYEGHYPCFLLLWAQSFFMPMFFVFSFFARAANLHYEYKANKAKMIYSRSNERRRESLYSSISNMQVRKSVELNENHHHSYPPYPPITSQQQQQSVNLDRRKSEAMLLQARKGKIPLFVAFAFVIHLIISILAQIYTKTYAFGNVICVGPKPEMRWVQVINNLYIIVGLPILLHKLNNVKDAFFIKRDVCRSITVALPLYSVFLLVKYWEPYQFIRNVVPAETFITISLIVYHTSSITSPVWYIFRNSKSETPFTVAPPMQSTPLPSIREEYVDQGRVLTDSIIEINIRRKPSLAEITNVDMIFDDPILLERFRDFTVLDFSVENLCFYEEYRDFKHALTLFNVDPGSNQNRQSLAEPNDEEITNPEIIQMILNIYSEYIMNGSPSELNLTEFARLGVSVNIENKNYFASIFDNVAGEILRLMNGCSLMRFIAMEKEGKRFETS